MGWDRKDFEEKMRPCVDRIYNERFKNIKSIDRVERDDPKSNDLMLDIKYGIDTKITFEDGSILTFQEKVRKFRYISFNDFTFEYYNDPDDKIFGEWFYLASQLYFYGYANENDDDIIYYYIIDVPRFRLFLNDEGSIYNRKWRLEKNAYPAMANFLPIPFEMIPDDCIIYQEEIPTNKIHRRSKRNFVEMEMMENE